MIGCVSRGRENRDVRLCGLAAAISADTVHIVRLADGRGTSIVPGLVRLGDFGLVYADIWRVRAVPYAQRGGAG